MTQDGYICLKLSTPIQLTMFHTSLRANYTWEHPKMEGCPESLLHSWVVALNYPNKSKVAPDPGSIVCRSHSLFSLI